MGWNTTYALRYITAAFGTIAVLSIFFAEHPNNNSDFEEFNYALTHNKKLKLSLASSIAITIPMLIDMFFDSIYYPNLDPLLFERAMFAFSLLILSIAPLCYKLGSNFEMPRFAQIYITAKYCQHMILFFCSVAVLQRYHSKLWTGSRCIALVTVFNIGQTLLCYFANSCEGTMKDVVFNIVAFVNYLVFALYLILTYYTTGNIYERAKKFKEETGYMNVESNDMISLIFLYGVILYFFVLAVYTNVMDISVITDRNGTQLTFITYCLVVLTIMMVVLPSRMVRFEVVNVKHALETKKSIARHVYHEMRTPLNIVVIGLELLSNALAMDHTSSTEIDEENGEVIRRDHDIDEKDTELVDIMDNVMLSCATTVEILNDMLVFEKLEIGSYTLNLQYLNLVRFVKHTLKPFLMQAKAKNIKVKLINLMGGFDAAHPKPKKMDSLIDPHCINVDPVKMAQVVRNFVSNALKFTPNDGTITVVMKVIPQENSSINKKHEKSIGSRLKQISESIFGNLWSAEGSGMPLLRRDAPVVPSPNTDPSGDSANSGLVAANSQDSSTSVDSDGVTAKNETTNRFGKNSTQLPLLRFKQDSTQPMVRISVTDTGAGISSADIRHLFHDGVQFNADELQEGGGSGFGLKIAKSIVDLHGGRVGAFSTGLGKGSTFHADLPLHLLQNDESAVAVDTNGLIKLVGNSLTPDGRRDRKNSSDVAEKSTSFSKSSVSAGGELSPKESYQDKSFSGNANAHANAPESPGVLTILWASVLYMLGLEEEEEIDTEFDLLKSDAEWNGNGGTSRKSSSVSEEKKAGFGKTDPIVSTSGDNSNVQLDKRRSSVGMHVDFRKIRRVLLVDDSAVCRRMVRKVLQSVNKQLHIDDVSDGKTCLKIISKDYQKFLVDKKKNPEAQFQSYYDVIILDHAMPGFSGPQTALELRRPLVEDAGSLNTHFDGLVVGLSGLTDSADVDEFIQAGVDMVLTKPLDTRKLLDVLKQYDQVAL